MKLLKIFFIVSLCSHYLLNYEKLLAESNSPAIVLQSYLENLNSFAANFQQQMLSSSGRQRETTSGKFLMKRPNRFRWQIMAPYEQLIIADGENIWSIDVDLEQVTVANIGDSLANSPIMLISQHNSQLERFFSVQLKPSDNDLELFLLTPKDNSSNFEFIQLGFKDTLLNVIELHDSLGQITIITMTNIRNNPVLGDKPFIYQQMQGFDVIDSRVKAAASD